MGKASRRKKLRRLTAVRGLRPWNNLGFGIDWAKYEDATVICKGHTVGKTASPLAFFRQSGKTQMKTDMLQAGRKALSMSAIGITP